ncbi:MAG: sulfatase-like hydrolase/transferase [Planctomycetota bacterium]|nr:sulfatase-like hydrolase/transferase [Planctomycetota bacterium]
MERISLERPSVLLYAVTLATLGGGPAALAKAEKPNIVVILADDLGWSDVGYHGGPIRTPHIDRLAREGVELDRFYSCPMCSPTRAGLLTGRYPIRYGLARAVIPPWRDFGLDTTEVTLPEALARAGYRHRGIFGKWHLGHRRAKWHPLARGFTRFRGHYNGAIDYFTHERDGERDWHVDYEPSDEKGYSTELIARAAGRFIEKHAADGPFLCYVPFNAPHGPFQAPQAYLDRYPDVADGRKRTLSAMISCLDDGVGRILESIDRGGIRENTLVWFFSDNGGVRAVKDNNLPLRGDKLDVFEGGVRVPACVRWPARLRGGRKVTAPLAYIDVLPTLLRIAGVDEPPGKPLDGLDVLDVLTGEKPTLARDLFHYQGQSGPRQEKIALATPRWKLVVLGPNVAGSPFPSPEHRVFLFDIQKDPNEKKNLAAQHPDTVERLAGRLKDFRRLQPPDGVPEYGRGRQGFRAPKDWRVKAPAPQGGK